MTVDWYKLYIMIAFKIKVVYTYNRYKQTFIFYLSFNIYIAK